ncbi:alpha/beta fold hydrolase [Apibacter raozihei]|uniref:alpha/beta hydrolase n=1 Tax=Apibacter raozihei TaxID=2500547 RepID=UPI000FE32B79|nr:alpha/beta fold hydrolase [Apibacter raozihei]
MKNYILHVLCIFFISFFISSCNEDDYQPQYAYEARPEFLAGNKIGIIVVHGFTGSPQSMRPVAHKLNDLGYTIVLPLLEGHGSTPEIMEKTTYKDWANTVHQAYTLLKPKVDKIFVLGLSMGGTQSLHLAANYPVDGAIVINASVSTSPYEPLPEYDGYPRFLDGIGSDIKKPGVTEWAYKKVPLLCRESMDEFKEITSKELNKIACPVLIFRSIDDHVVDPETSIYIYNNLFNIERALINLENSYHVATLDYDQDLIVEKSHEFIQSVLDK